MNSIFVIAEAGVNHNGDEELAHSLVEVAAKSGSDAVKFQTFKAKKLVTETARKADYQIANGAAGNTQLEMLKRLELSEAAHKSLMAHAKKNNIQFLSTAFDLESLAFLVEEIGVEILKLPSGEITNAPLLLAHARYQLPMILSTGMASLEEISRALKILAYGYSNPNKSPTSFEEIDLAFDLPTCCEILRAKVTILHCTSEYPAPLDEVNLRAMDSIGELYRLNFGYSDHTEGILVPVLAAARGAVLIEKHFTVDKNLPGPDHKASIEPESLSEMVRQIRLVERILGKPQKELQPSEVSNKRIARRSLVAVKPIKKGETFCPENLDSMRPEGGLSPILYWDYLGKTASRDFEIGDFIG